MWISNSRGKLASLAIGILTICAQTTFAADLTQAPSSGPLSSNQSNWIEGSTVGVTKRSPTQANPVIFLNTFTGNGLERFPENTWATVDTAGLIPPTAKAIFLTGVLIITHGTSMETADLVVHFRADGESYDYNYNWQTVEASTQNGQRSPMAVWVPLSETGKFQFKWRRSTAGQYPEHSSYGVNLSLNAYLR